VDVPEQNSGGQFDPAVVDSLTRILIARQLT
jgi:HD-GYP domain-containing protein (c-di-GMP phosphodiesterase class II)